MAHTQVLEGLVRVGLPAIANRRLRAVSALIDALSLELLSFRHGALSVAGWLARSGEGWRQGVHVRLLAVPVRGWGARRWLISLLRTPSERRLPWRRHVLLLRRLCRLSWRSRLTTGIVLVIRWVVHRRRHLRWLGIGGGSLVRVSSYG